MRETVWPPVGARTALALAVALLCANTASAQTDASSLAHATVTSLESLPFFVGERLTYRTRVTRVGNVGSGTMWVEGPVTVRAQSTYHLRFDFETRIGPVKVVNQTESWLDPLRMRALRFHKRERHPLSKQDQHAELYPDERRWSAPDGSGGETVSELPLDELSYLYFVRTLPLVPDSTYRFDRHFEASRNPTAIRVVGRESVVTPAGTFRTLLIEMRVKDTRRFRGDGVLWINITDDACRLPVRIQSEMPIVGTAVLTLESHTHAAGHHGAIARRATAAWGNP